MASVDLARYRFSAGPSVSRSLTRLHAIKVSARADVSFVALIEEGSTSKITWLLPDFQFLKDCWTERISSWQDAGLHSLDTWTSITWQPVS